MGGEELATWSGQTGGASPGHNGAGNELLNFIFVLVTAAGRSFKDRWASASEVTPL